MKVDYHAHAGERHARRPASKPFARKGLVRNVKEALT